MDPKAMAALGAGLAIGLGALGVGLGMGNAVSHALEAGARQPEIFGKIQTLLLTAIVFLESLCIYALVVALLLIFTVK
ncbi:MAG: ATP synthase F0 subunit C [Clostridiales bacterium]|nr:ATP synthase F0 subunit C [Clostridiales bacterium]